MGPFNNIFMSYFMLELESHCVIFPSHAKLPTRKKPHLEKKLHTKSSSSEEDSSDEASVEYFMYLIRAKLVNILIYKDDDKIEILSTVKLFI